jgi:hypothetical protein
MESAGPVRSAVELDLAALDDQETADKRTTAR